MILCHVISDGLFLCGDVDGDTVSKLQEECNQDSDNWEVTLQEEGDGGGSQSYLRSSLDNQFLFRDKYGHRRGSQGLFCSWECARVWNHMNTPVQHRHATSQLISIAQGRFV